MEEPSGDATASAASAKDEEGSSVTSGRLVVVCDVPPAKGSEFLGLIKPTFFRESGTASSANSAKEGDGEPDAASPSPPSSVSKSAMPTPLSSARIFGHSWTLRFATENDEQLAKKALLDAGFFVVTVGDWTFITVTGEGGLDGLRKCMNHEVQSRTFVRAVEEARSPKRAAAMDSSSSSKNDDRAPTYLIATCANDRVEKLKERLESRGWQVCNVEQNKEFPEFLPAVMRKIWSSSSSGEIENHAEKEKILLTSLMSRKFHLDEEAKTPKHAVYDRETLLRHRIARDDLNRQDQTISASGMLKLTDREPNKWPFDLPIETRQRVSSGFSPPRMPPSVPSPAGAALRRGTVPLYSAAQLPHYPVSTNRSSQTNYAPWMMGDNPLDISPNSFASMSARSMPFRRSLPDYGFPGDDSARRSTRRLTSTEDGWMPTTKEVEQAAAEALLAAKTRSRKLSLDPAAPEFKPAANIDASWLSHGARAIYSQLVRRRLVSLCQDSAEKGKSPISLSSLPELYADAHGISLDPPSIGCRTLLDLAASLQPHVRVDFGADGSPASRTRGVVSPGSTPSVSNARLQFIAPVSPKLDRFLRSILVAVVIHILRMEAGLDRRPPASSGNHAEFLKEGSRELDRIAQQADSRSGSRGVNLMKLHQKWTDTLGAFLPLPEVFKICNVASLAEFVSSAPELECAPETNPLISLNSAGDNSSAASVEGNANQSSMAAVSDSKDAPVVPAGSDLSDLRSLRAVLVSDRVGSESIAPDILYAMFLLSTPYPANQLLSLGSPLSRRDSSAPLADSGLFGSFSPIHADRSSPLRGTPTASRRLNEQHSSGAPFSAPAVPPPPPPSIPPPGSRPLPTGGRAGGPGLVRGSSWTGSGYVSPQPPPPTSPWSSSRPTGGSPSGRTAILSAMQPHPPIEVLPAQGAAPRRTASLMALGINPEIIPNSPPNDSANLSAYEALLRMRAQQRQQAMGSGLPFTSQLQPRQQLPNSSGPAMPSSHHHFHPQQQRQQFSETDEQSLSRIMESLRRGHTNGGGTSIDIPQLFGAAAAAQSTGAPSRAPSAPGHPGGDLECLLKLLGGPLAQVRQSPPQAQRGTFMAEDLEFRSTINNSNGASSEAEGLSRILAQMKERQGQQ